MNRMKLVLVTLSLLFISLASRADDVSAQAKYDEATVLFEQRSDAAKLNKAITLLKAAETEVDDSDLKYGIFMLHSECLYWQGTHTKGDKEKAKIHLSGQVKANSATEENEDYADGYYYSAAHLGRWAEANGVIASLSKKGEIIDLLEQIFDLDTSDGEAGETYAGYGADRVLGRLYFKLPGFAGGSREKSLRHLKVAATKAPNYALNTIYYAETLYSGFNNAQKAQAKQILDALLAKDPKTLNPARVPETAEEFVIARKLRSEMR